MKATKILAVLLVGAFSVSAFAQTATPNIDKREARQQKRIANGVASGELTAKETANLERREAKIDAHEQAAKADGVVTKAERAKLQMEQNRASAKIYNKKHNARTSN